MTNKYLLLLTGTFLLMLSGCSSTKEYVMPFKNYIYSGERLFPVSTSDAEFSFRAWVSYSTSIDRVFTISYSKDLDYDGKLLEIQLNMPGRNKKDNTRFKQINIVPIDGFEKFIQKVDSLNLMEVKTQNADSLQVPIHHPFSLYVIEIKSHGKTHQFRFNTYYPYKEKVEDKYEEIQKLIFQEFNFKFYFPDPKQ